LSVEVRPLAELRSRAAVRHKEEVGPPVQHGQGANATGGRVATGGVMGSGGEATTTATGGAKATGGMVATGGSSSGSSNPDGGLSSNTGRLALRQLVRSWRQLPDGQYSADRLSATTDTYDTALATANAILSGFQTVLKANSIRVGSTSPRCQVPGGRRATRPSSTQPSARTQGHFGLLGSPQW